MHISYDLLQQKLALVMSFE